MVQRIASRYYDSCSWRSLANNLVTGPNCGEIVTQKVRLGPGDVSVGATVPEPAASLLLMFCTFGMSLRGNGVANFKNVGLMA
jgi:hypothetical protein